MIQATPLYGQPSPVAFERLERRTLLSADPVLDWNAVALQASADDHTPTAVSSPDQGGPTRTARALAIVHAAIYDAVNGIVGGYEPYLVKMKAARGASVAAAVAQAAHDTLVAVYPKQAEVFDDALEDALDEIPDGHAEHHGVTFGRQVARAVLKARAGDGADADMVYDEPHEPGVFQMFPGEPGTLDPMWGDVTPFTMGDVEDFLAPPPPALDSPEYATAYNEVKNFGGDGHDTPTVRTEEQKEIGIFWAYDGTPGLGTPPRLYNQIARHIADQERNTPVENARLFALINLAMADAGIASWGTKYEYDLWRPIRGIRQVGVNGESLDDGNAGTEADPDWTPLGAPFTNASTGGMNFTPPFPAYTSGHATFGAAVFKTLARFYGTDDIAFTFTSDEYNDVNRDADGMVRELKPRSFTSFSQAAEENGQSRIYLGIHWAFDKTAGIAQGNAIADHAFENFLRPRGTVSTHGHGHGHGHGHASHAGAKHDRELFASRASIADELFDEAGPA